MKWNFLKISSKISTRENTIKWLEELDLIPQTKYCKTHKKEMIIQNKNIFGLFVCNTKNKRHTISRADNTWFERSKFSPEICMLITYCFAKSYSFQQTIEECSIFETNVSNETISDRFSFAREVCMFAMDNSFELSGKIGGVGCIVEIDETKIGKRKYERGRIVEGSWILGMTERNSSNYRLEICPNNKRNKNTLEDLIKKHVIPGK